MSAKPSRRQSLTPSRASISAFRRSSVALQHPVGNEAIRHEEVQSLNNDADTVAAFIAALGNESPRRSSRHAADATNKGPTSSSSGSPSRSTSSALRQRDTSHFQQDPSAVQDLSAYLQRTASASLAQHTSGTLHHEDRPSLTELRPLSRYDLLSSAPDSRYTSALNLNDPSYLPSSAYAYEPTSGNEQRSGGSLRDAMALSKAALHADDPQAGLSTKHQLFASGQVLHHVGSDRKGDTSAENLADELGSTDTMYRLNDDGLPAMGAESVVHLGPNPIDEAKKQLLAEAEMAKGPTEEEKQEMARQTLITQVQNAVRKYNALLSKNAGAQSKTLDYLKRKRVLLSCFLFIHFIYYLGSSH